MEWETAGTATATGLPTSDSTTDWSFNPEALFFTASAVSNNEHVRRAETPSILTELATINSEDIPESEGYRCTQEYHQFYYSQMPRDPRMPVPLKARGGNNNTGVQQSAMPVLTAGGVALHPQHFHPMMSTGKSSLTGDIVSVPRMQAHQMSSMPGRVVTPATAATLLNDPSGAGLPPGARVVYVTDPPKAITPSTIYVVLPHGAVPPPGATVIQAPPSFSMEPPRTGSGQTHMIPAANSPGNMIVSANGQILIATAPSPPNQFMQQHQPVMMSYAPGGFLVASSPQGGGRTGAAGTTSLGGGAQQTAKPTTDAVVRHPLVQQFVDTKTSSEWNLKVIVGHIVEFSKDQDGSRFIQKQLDISDNIPLVWNEIYPVASELMCDVFGNYVVQRLFDTVGEEQKLALVELLKGNVLRLAVQTYGCRVLQKALDAVPSQHMAFVAEELRGHIPTCVYDQNANHVVQKCIERMASKCQFVADAFMADLKTLSCHAYGCRVMQKLFEACYYDDERVLVNPYAPTDLTPLLQMILERVDELVLNQFGNYVVQHGMMNCNSRLQKAFISKLSPRIYELSQSKFGSNVAEKLVELASESQRDEILKLLIHSRKNADDEPPVVSMMRHAFANYVVQRLLDRSTPAQQQEIVKGIAPFTQIISEATYGKHLLGRMDKMGLLAHSNKEQRNSSTTDGVLPDSASGSKHHTDGSKGAKRNTKKQHEQEPTSQPDGAERSKRKPTRGHIGRNDNNNNDGVVNAPEGTRPPAVSMRVTAPNASSLQRSNAFPAASAQHHNQSEPQQQQQQSLPVHQQQVQQPHAPITVTQHMPYNISPTQRSLTLQAQSMHHAPLEAQGGFDASSAISGGVFMGGGVSSAYGVHSSNDMRGNMFSAFQQQTAAPTVPQSFHVESLPPQQQQQQMAFQLQQQAVFRPTVSSLPYANYGSQQQQQQQLQQQQQPTMWGQQQPQQQQQQQTPQQQLSMPMSVSPFQNYNSSSSAQQLMSQSHAVNSFLQPQNFHAGHQQQHQYGQPLSRSPPVQVGYQQQQQQPQFPQMYHTTAPSPLY